jgi:hypothetical protein
MIIIKKKLLNLINDLMIKLIAVTSVAIAYEVLRVYLVKNYILNYFLAKNITIVIKNESKN